MSVVVVKKEVDRAVLLAAGRGTRLRPYTDSMPKPLLVHRGKPTLDYMLDSLQRAGVNDIVLVTHYLSEQIEHYAQVRTASHQQRVRCVYQPQLCGTAHALQTVIDQTPDIVESPFILSATDYLIPRNFIFDLLGFHAQHSAALTVSMKHLDADDMAGRSSIRFRDDLSIAEIVEKPAPGTAPSDTGANLTFVLPSEITPYLQDVPVSERGEQEVQQAINQWISDGGQARGLVQAVPPEWQAPV